MGLHAKIKDTEAQIAKIITDSALPVGILKLIVDKIAVQLDGINNAAIAQEEKDEQQEEAAKNEQPQEGGTEKNDN